MSVGLLDSQSAILCSKLQILSSYFNENNEKIDQTASLLIHFRARVNPPNESGCTKEIDRLVAENRGQLDMIMVILPSPNLSVYAAVKKACSLNYGSKRNICFRC